MIQAAAPFISLIAAHNLRCVSRKRIQQHTPPRLNHRIFLNNISVACAAMGLVSSPLLWSLKGQNGRILPPRKPFPSCDLSPCPSLCPEIFTASVGVGVCILTNLI